MGKLIKRQFTSGGSFTEVQVMLWLAQVASALEYIHSMKVLHRDLKSSNIFLDRGAEGGAMAKLGDFGLSRILECTADAACTLVGTPYYMSPEVCRSEPYSYKSDIWSLGCVLYELCMLRHAFHSSSLQGIVAKIASGAYDPITAQYSAELASLVGEMLAASTESRPSASELLSRPHVMACLEVGTPLAEELPVFSTPPGTPNARARELGLTAATGGILGGTPPGTPPHSFFTCADQDMLAAAARGQ